MTKVYCVKWGMKYNYPNFEEDLEMEIVRCKMGCNSNKVFDIQNPSPFLEDALGLNTGLEGVVVK